MAKKIKKKKKPQFKADIHDVIAATDNEFVADLDVNNGKLIYTKDFYVAMYKHLQAGMTANQAYEACGFDVKKLGANRASQAAKHAREKGMKTGFTIDPASYDGSMSREAMGDLSSEEEIAYLKARNIYLEEMIEFQKKIPSILAEELTSWKNQEKK